MKGDFCLNGFFTHGSFDELINNQCSDLYKHVVERYTFKANYTNYDFLKYIYGYMSKNYRNEYFYQNTMLNKLLLEKHSLDTTTALRQVLIANSKADFILINDKAVVYEIKTELDNFERLEHQIKDYYKAFNYVTVITSAEQYSKLNEMLKNTPVGISVLSNRNTIQIKKIPEKFEDNLTIKTIFNVLNKKEYENIISRYYGYLPETKPVFYYSECLAWASAMPIDVLYEEYLKELKKRNHVSISEIKDVPYELKSIMYFFNADKSDYQKLQCFLNKKIDY